MKRKPSWNVYHNLGESVASRLQPRASFTQIGEHFGCRKQKVYHEAMIALGKVVYEMRKRLHEEDWSK